MNWKDFEHWGQRAATWAATYHQGLRNDPLATPVRSNAQHGDTLAQLPLSPPEQAEDMDQVFADFERIVMPGITHWQHPRFFAYFSANASPASVLAEYLSSSIAAQCMLWQTSPAATEMETRVVDWLRQGLGLPGDFAGVIQDSASSATLAAVLTMREKALNWAGNTQGLNGQGQLRVYASSEVHTSIDRAVWIAGIGGDNLVRVPTIGPLRSMDNDKLAAQIKADREAGYIPIGIIANAGGTSTGAFDQIAGLCAVAEREGLYVHVDAAWAGSAMICPEFRELWTGVELADSIVFNPHKWLGAQFDCSAHFVRNPADLVSTLAIEPEYLKTPGRELSATGMVNYSEWSVPLGRRFRALKLWFLMRAYGMAQLRTMLRNHVAWTANVCEALRSSHGFEIVTEPVLALFTFKSTVVDNQALVDAINDDGRIYLTQTRVAGELVIRFTCGSWQMEESDADLAVNVITEIAAGLAV